MAKKKSPPVSRKNKSSAAKKAAVTRKAKPSAQKNHAPTGINIIKKDGAKVEVAKSQQFTMPPQIDVSDGKARTALVTSWASNPKDAKIKHFEDDVWTVKTYDAEPKIEADYTGHIFKMDAIEDNSIDALWCQQIMQRYYMPHVLEALKEFKRVMRDDALLYINVPDGQLAAAHLAHENFYKPLYETPAGPITAVDIVYGYQKAILAGNRHMAHHSVFSLKQLGTLLRDAGFSDVKVHRRGYVIHASAYKHSTESGKFVERVSISSDEPTEDTPAAPKLPNEAKAAATPKRYVDNLADQPAQWNPLGLKDKR